MTILVNNIVAEARNTATLHGFDLVRFNSAKSRARALFYAGVCTEYKFNIGNNVWTFEMK